MLSGLVNILHHYRPQPILYQLGPIIIHWYGLLVFLAVLSGFFLVKFFIKKHHLSISSNDLYDLGAYLILFGLIGARLYHVLSEINYYQYHWLEIFYLWRGGLGIFGVVAAGLIVLYFFSRRKKITFWLLTDLLSPTLLLGEAIGRWGNWFNQENFGRPTGFSWGIPIDVMNRPAEYWMNEFFHPTFFYQFSWNLILLILLLFLLRWWKIGSGRATAFYLVFYSLGRFMIEFLRINYQPVFFGLRLAQIVCLLFFLSGLMIFYLSSKKIINR